MNRVKHWTPEAFEHWSIPEPNTGCWLWLRATDSSGYGSVMRRPGSPVGAHRLSYETHIGPIPAGMHVLHSCDQRACVNPRHLHLGTNSANVAERVARGRSARQDGDKNPNRTLSSADVDGIRKRLSGEESAARIGMDYGVSKTTILRIKNGQNWGTHVG